MGRLIPVTGSRVRLILVTECQAAAVRRRTRLPGWPGRPSHPIAKPPGYPVLPVDPSWSVPVGPPTWPGDWIPVDPGYGLPPIYGWRPVDPGFGVGAGAGGTPTQPIALPGHWIPVDPGYGLPRCPEAVKPIWVWIAEIGPNFGLKPQPKK